MQTSIAVVGGGMAGLACARALRRRGLRPVIFEASRRIGGRCTSRITPVGTFDDGAQVIHDADALAQFLPKQGHSALQTWYAPMPPRDDDDEDAVSGRRAIGMVGAPAMQTLSEVLSASVDVRTGAHVIAALRSGDRWVLHTTAGEVEQRFAALALAAPAPCVLPLARHSALVSGVLRTVRFRSRWILMLGLARPLGLTPYREYDGGPIERIAANHAKPGRSTTLAVQERWTVEAGARWSEQHDRADEETVTELMLANLREHAGRPLTPNFLAVQRWPFGQVEPDSLSLRGDDSVWDADVRLGACGDSLVESRVERVVASGVELADRIAADVLGERRHRNASVRHGPLLSSFASREDKRRRMVLLV